MANDLKNSPFAEGAATSMTEIQDEIRSLIMQKNYPCIAAVQSVVRHDYDIGTYLSFGSGLNGEALRRDLLNFLEKQRATDSKFLSYWAVFAAQNPDDEATFETKLWRELSGLTSEAQRASDWAEGSSSDPSDPSFCVSLNGEKLFVVGLHPKSSRLGRRFSRPALVFNAFAQFEKFEQEGTYVAMVKTNRDREMKFQGSLNPMVVAHGDEWESIQYSGRENDARWKCPFHFAKENNK